MQRRSASRVVPCRAATTEEGMKAAQARWEEQIRDGRVRNITPADVNSLLADGYTLLDVRPPTEISKAQLENAVEVPLFVLEDDPSVGTLIKQATAFGMGGWWLGGAHMKPNPNFLGEVQARIPQDAKLLVVCQKGLRSLAACEQLARAGYKTLAWVNGGLDTARPGQVATKNGVDIRMAGIGGLSELLGWTEVQQETGKGFAGGYQNIIKGVAVLLAVDMVWFLYTVFGPQ